MFYVYILASDRNGTLYTGHTDYLLGRMTEHRARDRRGFTAKYGVAKLVWFETHETRDAAFARERAIKKWLRLWKLRLIERHNPGWIDLAEALHHPSEHVPDTGDYAFLDPLAVDATARKKP